MPGGRSRYEGAREGFLRAQIFDGLEMSQLGQVWDTCVPSVVRQGMKLSGSAVSEGRSTDNSLHNGSSRASLNVEISCHHPRPIWLSHGQRHAIATEHCAQGLLQWITALSFGLRAQHVL